MMVSNPESLAVGIGFIGVLLLLSVVSLVSPLLALAGIWFILPFLLLYVLYSFGPTIQNIWKNRTESTFSYEPPNYSATHISSSSSKEDTQKAERETDAYNSSTESESKDTDSNYETTSTNSDQQNNNKQYHSQTTDQKSASTLTSQKAEEIREAEKTLGLSGAYTRQELEEAYRSDVKKAHPDMSTGSSERFKQVQESYELLIEEKMFTKEK